MQKIFIWILVAVSIIASLFWYLQTGSSLDSDGQTVHYGRFNNDTVDFGYCPLRLDKKNRSISVNNFAGSAGQATLIKINSDTEQLAINCRTFDPQVDLFSGNNFKTYDEEDYVEYKIGCEELNFIQNLPPAAECFYEDSPVSSPIKTEQKLYVIKYDSKVITIAHVSTQFFFVPFGFISKEEFNKKIKTLNLEFR